MRAKIKPHYQLQTGTIKAEVEYPADVNRHDLIDLEADGGEVEINRVQGTLQIAPMPVLDGLFEDMMMILPRFIEEYKKVHGSLPEPEKEESNENSIKQG